jgi:hypothetical protein
MSPEKLHRGLWTAEASFMSSVMVSDVGESSSVVSARYNETSFP